MSVVRELVRSGTDRREATLCLVGGELTKGRVAVVGAGGDIIEVMPSDGSDRALHACEVAFAARG